MKPKIDEAALDAKIAAIRESNRGGTAFTFPDENLIKYVKLESVKNLELCRNAILDRPISEKMYSSILPDENLTKFMKPEPVKGVELCRICYLNVLAKRAKAA